MLINIDLLQQYGAETTNFEPHQKIFNEGDTPKCYYQIVNGRVKLNH